MIDVPLSGPGHSSLVTFKVSNALVFPSNSGSLGERDPSMLENVTGEIQTTANPSPLPLVSTIKRGGVTQHTVDDTGGSLSPKQLPFPSFGNLDNMSDLDLKKRLNKDLSRSRASIDEVLLHLECKSLGEQELYSLSDQLKKAFLRVESLES